MSEIAESVQGPPGSSAASPSRPVLRFLDFGEAVDGGPSSPWTSPTDDEWEDVFVLPPPAFVEDPLGEDEPLPGPPEIPPADEQPPSPGPDDAELADDPPPLVLTLPGPPPSQATLLVQVALERGHEYLRSSQGVPYARIAVEKGDAEGTVHLVEEVVPMVEQGIYRDWLEWQFHDLHFTEPRPAEIKKAITQLRRQCLLGPVRRLEPRSVMHDGAIWIDAGEIDRTAFRITASGVETIANPPTLWWRPNSLGALPPLPLDAVSHDLWSLLDMVNLPTAERHTTGLLLVVSTVMGFVPPTESEHPLLLFTGPEGSGKSTAADMYKWIVDPPDGQFGVAGRVRLRSSRDLLVVMYNNLVTHFDNVSPEFVTQRVSDELSSAVTGANISGRRLFKDLEQEQASFRRTIVMTGIVNPIRSSDLLSRTLHFRLPMIERTPDSHAAAIANKQRFMDERPLLVGACLHRLSEAMAMPEPQLAYATRFAEWCSLACRVAVALGATQQQFEDALRANMVNQRRESLDEQPFAAAVVEIVATRKTWRGTATELLDEVNDAGKRLRLPMRERDTWPQHPRALSGHLQRSAATLADLGVRHRTAASHGRDLIVIEKS